MHRDLSEIEQRIAEQIDKEEPTTPDVSDYLSCFNRVIDEYPEATMSNIQRAFCATNSYKHFVEDEDEELRELLAEICATLLVGERQGTKPDKD